MVTLWHYLPCRSRVWLDYRTILNRRRRYIRHNTMDYVVIGRNTNDARNNKGGEEMNITHEHPAYIQRRKEIGSGKYNGCYYYSKEIVDNIIPLVKTKREWTTVGRDVDGMHNGMIVFLHDNSTPWHYQWLKNYDDLVLVCSSEYTARSVIYSGHVVYLPMNIDTRYVKQFRTKKDRETCFVGNSWVYKNLRSRLVTSEVDFLTGMPRQELLKELARYKKAYAIDRCAQEAKVLGCEVLPTETRYGCDETEVLDNRDAAVMLQRALNIIDKGGKDEQVSGDVLRSQILDSRTGTWH